METHDRTCTYCRKRLEIGHDMIGVQHGVNGRQRFIPLEEPLLFCSEPCLRRHYDDVPTLPPRIP